MSPTKPTKIYIFNVIFLLLYFLIPLNLNSQDLLAFPTAVGAGAYTTGGRGGTVYHVTNLNSSGAGSLADALSQSNRIVVFDVSGIINVDSNLVGGLGCSSNITIAGQTAPEGGITIDGNRTYFANIDNLIVRHIRFKGGNDNTNTPQDSFSATGDITNQIYDHCSFAFGGDECASWYSNGNGEDTDNITVQRCLFSESSKGVIIGGGAGYANFTGEVSFLNNMFYNASYRFPNATGDGGTFEIINNVQWTSAGRAAQINGANVKANYIGNYQDWGNYQIKDRSTNLSEYTTSNYPQIYTSGNKFVAQNTTTPLTYTVEEMNADNKRMWGYFNFNQPNDGNRLPADYFTDTQYPLLGNPITIQTADDAFADVKSDVGCNARLNADGSVSDNTDVLDANSLNQVNLGNYVSKISSANYDVPAITSVSRPVGFYVSNPHIPEAYLTARGITGNAAIHNEIQASGYALLEEYLNEVDGDVEIVNRPQITRTDTNPTTIEVGGAYVPPTGTWTDVEDGSGEATVGGDTVDVNTIGTYNVILEHTDTDGNRGFLTIPINIIAEVINAIDVNVTPAVASVEVGNTIPLTAVVNGATGTATDQSGIWSSNNGNVTVNAETGVVTGVALGNSVITFTSTDGNFTDTSEISVTQSTVPTAISFVNGEVDNPNWMLIDENTVNPIATLVTTDPDLNATHTYSIPTTNVDDYDRFSIVNGNQLQLNLTPDFENPLDTAENNIYALNVRTTSSSGGTFDQFMLFRIQDVIDELPIASAGSDQSICEGETITLTATGGPNYLWDTGETTAAIEVTPSQTTTYTVIVSNNNGDEDTDSVTVNVDTPPNLTISDNITILEGDNTTLTASGANEYLWSTDETTNSIIVAPTQTTTYTVTGSNGGCDVQAQVTVTVEEIFEASAGEDERVCDSGTYEVVLTANEGDTYLWSTGETTQSVIVSPLSTTSYSVTVTSGNQEDTDDVTVYVDPTPNVTISNGASVDILEGDFITLSASGANSYQWSNGATQPNIAVSPSATTTYEVTGYIGDCFDEKQITVNVFEPVAADAGDDVFICIDETATLTATGGDEYVWSTGEITQTIQVSPMQTTDYTVTVFNALDYDEATVRVEVDANCDEEPIEPEDDSLEFSFDVYPNPASDVVNIRLNGSLQVSQIYVFDLTGKVIQQTTITNENQDLSTTTQIDITSLQPGVYFVKLVDEDIDITKKLIVN